MPEKRKVIIAGIGPFESASEAARTIGATPSNVCRACSGRYKVSGYEAKYGRAPTHGGIQPSAVRLDGYVFDSLADAGFYAFGHRTTRPDTRRRLIERGAIIIDPPPPRPKHADSPLKPLAGPTVTTKEILADAARMLLDSGRIEDAARVLEMAVTA